MSTATRKPPKLPLNHDPASLKWAREAKGWTQTGLAAEVGVSKSHLSEVESGSRNAPPTLLNKLAAALNCPVTMLERKREAAGV